MIPEVMDCPDSDVPPARNVMGVFVWRAYPSSDFMSWLDLGYTTASGTKRYILASLA